MWHMTRVSAFQAIAEPRRRQILDLLRVHEHSVNELVDALGMSQPAVSKHLSVLRAAQLVEAEVDAQRRVYRLRSEPLAELEAWLAPYRALWSHHLDRLERHLDGHADHGHQPPRARKKRRRRP